MIVRSAVDAVRPPEVQFVVDGGDSVAAPAGEPLATALAAAGYLAIRRSPRAQSPRGAFCFIGVCQECSIYVDGVLRQACITPVSEGMVVELRGTV